MAAALLSRSACATTSTLAEGGVNTAPECSLSTDDATSFSIAHLPVELRQQIYGSYIKTLAMVEITAENAALPLHVLHPLAFSSPFFPYDIPSQFYYQNATFSFSSGADMRAFSELHSRKREVKNIIIYEGKDESPTRDWVFLMNDCFENLESVEFILSKKKGLCRMCGNNVFESWWGALRDAVRESRCGRQRSLVLKVRQADGEEDRCGGSGSKGLQETCNL